MKRILLMTLAILTLISITSCKDDKKDQKIETVQIVNSEFDWFKYISAHTSGKITRQSEIKVLLVKEPDKKVDAMSLFSFEPKLEGRAKWNGDREVVFIPEKDLEEGIFYKGSFDLSKLVKEDLPEDKFNFGFSAIERNYEANIEGFLYEKNEGLTLRKGKMASFTGTIITSDREKKNDVEKIIEIKKYDEKLDIDWDHNDDGLTHKFTVKNIKRSSNPITLNVSWNGEHMNINKSGNASYELSAIGDFKVENARAVNENTQYIELRFSDVLDPKQDINGLITIDGHNLRLSKFNNIIKVYSDKAFTGKIPISISYAIKNIDSKPMTQTYYKEATFELVKPAIRFVGKGIIIPNAENLTVPFEAIGLKSVQVTALQVYESNIGFFLQENNLDGENELDRVGRHIFRKTIQLTNDDEVATNWNRYNLDLSEIFASNPGSLFKFTLSFNRSNSVHWQNKGDENVTKEAPYTNSEDYAQNADASSWDYSEASYYSYNNADWEERNDPTKDAYYKEQYNKSSVKSERSFITSNIGLIAKKGDNDILTVATTDIMNAKAYKDCDISVFNYQNQVIGSAKTDNNGFANITIKGTPFYIKAQNKKDIGYLKVNLKNALSMSHFDIGGEKVKNGVKGFIYGERGVWRPGDELFLTFVLKDKNIVIPENHPVIMDIFNPKGQIVKTIKPNASLNGFYTFSFKTQESDITGDWRATVRIGGMSFDKNLKIETVVPNRLKVQLDFGKDTLYASDETQKASIFSQWLHGASASGLLVKVKVYFSNKATSFRTFTDYIFNDPTREFSGGSKNLYEDYLDKDGKAQTTFNIEVENRPPGMLNATFESRVFEEGGGFSVDRVTVPYHYYQSYVGMKAPKGDVARGMLLTDTTQTVKIVTLDAHGKPISREGVEVYLYKINWKWWWDKTEERLTNYESASSSSIIQQGKINTKNGEGKWDFEVKYPDWGRYLIRVIDPVSGHSCGKVIYIDWPGWAGRAQQENGTGATRLNFTADKQKYSVGDTATIFLPSTTNSRALVSLESGNSVISQHWEEAVKGNNKFKIIITEKMAPNFYVNISLLQPHSTRNNDAPIRLFGVLPIVVENPKTKLEPKISCDDIFEPNTTVKVKIGEKNSKAMTYTIAIVDEGLLGLTRYQTPDLRSAFYKREALIVETWDMFDFVVGAYGGDLERVLGLGGDGAEDEKKREKEKRFPPVSIFKGPFHIDAGEEKTHEIKIPRYVGAVRVMVVAGDKEAYGCDDKEVKVKKDLMVLSNLPRVMRPNEVYDVPVNVFVLDDKMNKVDVSIEVSGGIEVVGSKTKSASFKKSGDKIVFFKVKTKDKIGTGEITITAKGKKLVSKESIHFDIVSSNASRVKTTTMLIKENATDVATIKPFGVATTNKLTVEISSLPQLNLEKHLQYLIQYPHGCLEQTTSKIFPQIYLKNLIELDDKQKQDIEKHVVAAIAKLANFQTISGGFSYWPSTNKADEWATNYAGHFILEAKKLGYHVPETMISKFIEYQKERSNNWSQTTGQSVEIQAYRLFTLVLSGNPDYGSMNRLREKKEITTLNPIWKVHLAYAFYALGQTDAGEELIVNSEFNVTDYQDDAVTFGSTLRDKSIMMMLLKKMNKHDVAAKLLKEITTELTTKTYLNTQESAYVLMALSEYYRNIENDNVTYEIALGDKGFKKATLKEPIATYTVDNFDDTTGMVIKVKNSSNRELFVSYYNQGVPKAGEEESGNNGLTLSSSYYYTGDGPSFDINNLKQGEEVICYATVKNTTMNSLSNIVLSQVFPSGWEISNPRFVEGSGYYGSAPAIDYQDIKDDRVFTYFNLRPKESKTFLILLNVSYTGLYYLPGALVESMYKRDIYAKSKGQWIEVKK